MNDHRSASSSISSISIITGSILLFGIIFILPFGLMRNILLLSSPVPLTTLHRGRLSILHSSESSYVHLVYPSWSGRVTTTQRHYVRFTLAVIQYARRVVPYDVSPHASLPQRSPWRVAFTPSIYEPHTLRSHTTSYSPR